MTDHRCHKYCCRHVGPSPAGYPMNCIQRTIVTSNHMLSHSWGVTLPCAHKRNSGPHAPIMLPVGICPDRSPAAFLHLEVHNWVSSHLISLSTCKRHAPAPLMGKTGVHQGCPPSERPHDPGARHICRDCQQLPSVQVIHICLNMPLSAYWLPLPSIHAYQAVSSFEQQQQNLKTLGSFARGLPPARTHSILL